MDKNCLFHRSNFDFAFAYAIGNSHVFSFDLLYDPITQQKIWQLTMQAIHFSCRKVSIGYAFAMDESALPIVRDPKYWDVAGIIVY